MNEFQFALSRTAEYVQRQALLDLYFSSKDVHKVHMVVMVLHPQTGLPMWDAPMDRVDERGQIVLNISPSAVGHFSHTETDTVMDARFNGKVKRLMFNSGLILSVVAIGENEILHTGRSTLVFIPDHETDDRDSSLPDESAPAKPRSHLKLVQ